jgi:acyl-CoA dehydrogenase
MTCRRALARMPFGKPLAEQGVMIERIANARIMIDQARLLVLHAAWKMDKVGNKAARREIAEIKVAVPNMACQVIDWAIQAHGAAGVTEDFGLAAMYKTARTMRIVDGPDEVHRFQLGRLEINKYRQKAAE